MPEDKADTIAPEAPAEEKKEERDTPEFWRKWIKVADKAGESHRQMAKMAWDEYENSDEKIKRPYPIYYSSCKTLEPAYYAKTPDLTTKRRFDIKDEIAMTGCLITERLGEYLLESVEFDACMHAAVQDFIHADKSTLQIVYDQSTKQQEDRVPLSPADTGEYYDDMGGVWAEDVYQDAEGFFGKRVNDQLAEQSIKLVSAPYDEIIHTPDAKSYSEVREIGYHFCLNKDEAEARFGDKAKTIQWKSKKAIKRGGDTWEGGAERENVESIGQYVEGWEIWSKPNRRVYWITDQYQGGFLDDRDDPYKLREFFPSPPFIIGSKPSRSLYPTPAFGQLLPLIEDMHESAEKFHELLSGIERRAMVNSSDEDFLLALNSRGNGTYVSAPNLTNIVEKAGIESLIYWVPVQPLTEALTEMNGIQEKFKNEFFEWFGVPDILRGATEAVETASAQQLKAEAAHDRFKWNKKLVAQLARDAIEMMIDLALGVFTDDKIAQCVGYEFMSPEDQARFPAALEMLRSDTARVIRIDIETDSMSFVDDQLRAQQIGQVVQSVTAGLKEVASMLEISPQAAAIGLQALLLSLDTMPAGKKLTDGIKQTVEDLIEQAKNPPEPPPPPPDYEAMKIQVEQQKIQAQSMRDQMDAQAKMRELDRKEYELQLKSGELVAKQQLEQYQMQLQRYVEETMIQLESQRVQIEQFKAQMQARESEMEEIRLAREVDLQAYQAAADSAKVTEPESATPPVINIINAAAPEPPKAEILPVPLL